MYNSFYYIVVALTAGQDSAKTSEAAMDEGTYFPIFRRPISGSAEAKSVSVLRRHAALTYRTILLFDRARTEGRRAADEREREGEGEREREKEGEDNVLEGERERERKELHMPILRLLCVPSFFPSFERTYVFPNLPAFGATYYMRGMVMPASHSIGHPGDEWQERERGGGGDEN